MQKHSSTIITLLVIASIITGVSFYTLQKSGSGTGAADGPDIEGARASEESPYTDLDGDPVSFDTYAGEVLVVNSWATWCPFCVEELPDLGELATEYADQGVRVIAINRKESPDTARAFVDHVGNPADIVFWLDSDDRFYESVGGFSMPETVFYDREGNVAVHKRGSMGIEEMRQHVETALLQSSGSQ